MTVEQLRELKNADKSTVDRVDITNITVDMDAPVIVRAEQYLKQIKNPYFFKCGDIAVNVEFTPNGKTIQEAITSYLITKKRQGAKG